MVAATGAAATVASPMEVDGSFSRRELKYLQAGGLPDFTVEEENKAKDAPRRLRDLMQRALQLKVEDFQLQPPCTRWSSSAKKGPASTSGLPYRQICR